MRCSGEGVLVECGLANALPCTPALATRDACVPSRCTAWIRAFSFSGLTLACLQATAHRVHPVCGFHAGFCKWWLYLPLKLGSHHLLQRQFVVAQVPEMARVPLEELVMQIHLLGQGPAAVFLANVLQPPPPRSIQAAVAHLQSLNALTPEEQLTPLGVHPHISQARRKPSWSSMSRSSLPFIGAAVCLARPHTP